MQHYPPGASSFTDSSSNSVARQHKHRVKVSRHTVESIRQATSRDFNLAEYPSSADLHIPLTEAQSAFPRDSFASTRRSSMTTAPYPHAAAPAGAPTGTFSAAPGGFFMGPVLQPARNWFEEMRWGRDKPKVQKRRKLQVIRTQLG